MKIVKPAYKFVDYMGNRVPVPAYTRFIAMDHDMHIHAFPFKPVFGGYNWVCESDEHMHLGTVETDLKPEDTMVEYK